MSRYRFIDGQRATHPVRLLCHVLRVPASGYYAWQHAQQQRITPSEPAWETALVKAFSHHKRRKYDAAFRAEALRLAAQSRSAQAAARALNIDPKRIYQWQKAAQTPVAAALGVLLNK